MLFDTFDFYDVYRKQNNFGELPPDYYINYQYYNDAWIDNDGWQQTVYEDWLPTTRGGIYRRDFISISGNYFIKIYCKTNFIGGLSIYGETQQDTFEFLGCEYFAQGDNVLEFRIFNNPTIYTGFGLIWDGNYTLEISKIYISTFNNVDYFTDPIWKYVATITARNEFVNSYEKVLFGQHFEGILTRKYIPIEYQNVLCVNDVLIDKDKKQSRIINIPEIYTYFFPHIEILTENLQYEVGIV